jgi:site-specific recombinase XerD
LITDWQSWLRHNKGRAETTTTKYGQYLQRLQSFLDGKPLLEASPQELEHFVGLHTHKQGLSPRSRRALVAAVRGFYAWAAGPGRRTHRNPAKAVEYPNAGRRLPVAMGLDNAERLLMQPDISTFIGVRDAAMLSVLIGCGVRVSGLVGMNESGLLFYRDGDVERLAIKVREKGGKERIVPAPVETRLLIRAYLGHAELEDIDRSLQDGDQVLWVSTRNRTVPEDRYHGEARRINRRTINDIILHYGEAAGIPKAQCHPHALRHLYGAELAEEDVDLLKRQALLGHEDPKTTEIYTHMAMRQLAKEVDRANPLRKIRTPVTDLARALQQRR